MRAKFVWTAHELHRLSGDGLRSLCGDDTGAPPTPYLLRPQRHLSDPLYGPRRDSRVLPVGRDPTGRIGVFRPGNPAAERGLAGVRPTFLASVGLYICPRGEGRHAP